MADAFGLTDRGHRRCPPTPAPSDRSKTAGLPIPSGNSVADPKFSLRVRVRSLLVPINLRSSFRRVPVRHTFSPPCEYHQKHRPDWLALDSPVEAAPAKFAPGSPQSRNRLRRRRTVFGSELHPAAAFAEAT